MQRNWPRLHVRLRGQYRVLRSPSRSEAVAVLAEGRVENWLQHLQQRLLDQPIHHRRDAQLALASLRFRDRHPSHRAWPVPSCHQTLADVGPTLANVLGGLLDVEPVYPCRAFVGLDPLPCQLQVLSRQRRFQQAACACLGLCRPCVPVLQKRAAGFVTDVNSNLKRIQILNSQQLKTDTPG